MKSTPWTAFFCAAALLAAHTASAAAPAPWRDVGEPAMRAGDGERLLFPTRFRMLALDSNALREILAQAPLEFTPEAAGKASSVELALPMPDGSSVRFRVEESPIMEPGLAAQFPEIKTYRGQGLDDGTAMTRFGWTAAGFHAIVFSERGTVYIDPYRRGDTTHYLSFFKRDYRAPAGDTFRCLVDELGDDAFAEPEPSPAFIPSGSILRTYRLALATTVEYSDFHSTATPPSVTDVMNNGVIPSVNRVSGVYERDVAIRMVLVANNNLIIWTQEPDPYTNNNGGAMLSQNQTSIDAIIGNANYDIGHVFSTGGGGVAQLRVPCVAGNKARGVTGLSTPIGDNFDIDYVAHEMGHQWGGNHTFNGNAGSCSGGNRNAGTAYEVGSGSTIQAYAGICGAQDLQPHSDDYFHNISFVEIQAYSTTGNGNGCAVQTPTGNLAPVIDAGPAFTIPSRTPFALTANGSDPDGDPLTYNWEEMDLGPAGSGQTDNGSSPILRSFNSTVSPTRIFPKLSDILNNTTTYGEILPTTSRTMAFRVTARDNRAGGGGVDWDATTVTSVAAAGPFVVTSPNTNITWPANGTATVTWNVAGTDAAPINTANVDIFLSTDSGLTFPTPLAMNTPNDGSHVVAVPNIVTNTARVKIQGTGNIFFDVSNTEFRIFACVAIAVDPATIPDGEAGAPYSTTFTQTNGTPPITWSVAGALPTGLSLNPSTGVLSGTPTQTGSFPITVTATDANGCTGSHDYTLVILPSTTAAAPVSLIVDDAGNDVLQTGETAVMEPTWLNVGASVLAGATGALSNFTGPAGPAYNIVDGTAAYGTIAVGDSASCVTTGDCYSLNITGSRPAQHWDATVLETFSPSGNTHNWTLHVGDSFGDVPAANGFYRFIETILHNGVTVGCTTSAYCPTASTTREAMAAFVLVANDPGGVPPPNCVAGSEAFTDVPASSGFCRWIEELFRRGVVTGCGTNLYCPTSSATREQMAVFVLRTLDPTLDPPACVAGSERFDDVPASSGFCRWIEELERRGVVTGCGGNDYCPNADVTREQMSVFLTVTFGLTLYGL